MITVVLVMCLGATCNSYDTHILAMLLVGFLTGVYQLLVLKTVLTLQLLNFPVSIVFLFYVGDAIFCRDLCLMTAQCHILP